MGVVEEGAEWPAEARAERLERVVAIGVQQVGETWTGKNQGAWLDLAACERHQQRCRAAALLPPTTSQPAPIQGA